MGKYLLNRIIRSIFSLILVVAIVFIFVYTLMDREAIFRSDNVISKKSKNDLVVYKTAQWEKYGYLDYVSLNEYCTINFSDDSTKLSKCNMLPYSVSDDSSNPYIAEFINLYTEKGYKITRLEGKRNVSGMTSVLFASKDYSVMYRLGRFLKNMIFVDSSSYVKEDLNTDQKRGMYWTTDPLNGMPAVMCNGCKHEYILYFDGSFPFLHIQWMEISLGNSVSLNQNKDIMEVMTESQGSFLPVIEKYPTGIVDVSTVDLHICKFSSTMVPADEAKFNTYYTDCQTRYDSFSKMGISFIIGVIATLIQYFVGVPIGIWMARKKDKLVDKIGTIYIIFIMAVPSLAYIFMFSRMGSKWFGLPNKYAFESSWLVYVLPVISLALPSIAGTMKWIRRYMIDQMNSDYVRFARAKGLSEGEIFSKHILKNAIIPIAHGIPGAIIACLTGAIITERVYGVPGMGRLFTDALSKNDNSVIVALTFLYTTLSIVSLILGDIVITLIDPRISFSGSGGRK